jgi:hypothetical protein
LAVEILKRKYPLAGYEMVKLALLVSLNPAKFAPAEVLLKIYNF